MLLTPDHFYLSPRSLLPARLIPSFPPPPNQLLSTFHSPRRDVDREKAERSKVTSQSRVLSSSDLNSYGIQILFNFSNNIHMCLKNCIVIYLHFYKSLLISLHGGSPGDVNEEPVT